MKRVNETVAEGWRGVTVGRSSRHSGQAQHERESRLDSRFRGNAEPRHIAYVFRPLRPSGLQTRPDCWLFCQTLHVSASLRWLFAGGDV